MVATVTVKNQKIVQETIQNMPLLFLRARRSAAGSTGYQLRKKLKRGVLTGTFKPLHPLRQKLQMTRTGKWRKRTGDAKPLKWLARFAQYYVVDNKKGRIDVHVGFRDANKGKLRPGTKLDKSLIGILRKHEHGGRIYLTEAMRDKLSEGLAKAGLKFLKESTTHLTIPKRPIMTPLYAQSKNFAVKHFEKKFVSRLKHYIRTGQGTNAAVGKTLFSTWDEWERE